MTQHTKGLSGKTKDQLVKIAYEIGCSERSICSENRGPFTKPVIIEAISNKRAAIAKATGGAS